MSCPICNDFQGFPKRAEMDPEFKPNRHWKKTEVRWKTLLSSAKSCPTCTVLLDGFRGCFAQHSINEDTDILHFNIDFAYPSRLDWEDIQSGVELEPPMDKEVEFRLSDGKRFEIEIFSVHENEEEDAYYWPASWEIFPGTKRTSPNTSSDAALAIVEGWVEGCLGKVHRSCKSPESPQLPTRVVDVGGNDSDKVRLVEPAGATGKYVCLSHCWGRKQIITTVKSSLKDHLTAGIPLTKLSNTFRQAVQFTRRLGIRYIWIDSLCIIQDDLQDWGIESAKMAEIYSNGYLTIAATHSADGDGGLYCETPSFEVTGTTPDEEEYFLLFRRRIDHHIDCIGALDLVPQAHRGHPTLSFHPLLTRAWVYQERMLSTRVLHFGPHELFFECRTEIQCECGNIPWHDTSDRSPVALTKLLHTDALTMGFAVDARPRNIDDPTWHQRRYIARLWRTMVATYTSLDITKASDRLPAIGGLARDMAKHRLRSKYLAGMWTKSLLVDLTWQANGASVYGRPRPDPPSAPSWSWASIDCPVTFGDEILAWDPECDPMFEKTDPRRWLCKLEKCEVTQDGVNEFGHVSGGLLVVTGRVAEGVLKRSTVKYRGRDVLAHHITLGGRDYKMSEDYCFGISGPGMLSPGEKVLCFRVSLVKRPSKVNVLSLVLIPSRDNKGTGKQYGRVGILTFSLEPDDLEHTGDVFRDENEQTITIV